ncbi:MAG: hypothetical protein NXI23_06560 [Bacteroidetes bacterium]|jgi:hypothetical protein|nr:hypothetical protein [Bacteroidota bacterium]MDF1866771.1 hypothetical protein [Saprospiraceae bacterium]
MILISIFSLLLSFQGTTTSTLEDHEFHVSKTLLEYKANEQSLQVTLNIFTDDLDLALEKKINEKLFLCTEKEHPESDTHLIAYFKQKFSIKINSEKSELIWIGKEPSDDLASVWCYLEIKEISKLEALDVQNNLLMELFEDQKNIVQIIGPEKKSGYFMFQKGNDSDSIIF